MFCGHWLATVSVLTVTAAATSTGQVSFDMERMQRADRLIEEAIGRKELPGGVLLVGQGDRTVYFKAYGLRTSDPQPIPMTKDTIFDMASVTKTVACATSIMILVERGKLGLADSVAKHIPAFGANGKEKVTVEQLLLHRGGFVPDNPMKDYADGPVKAWERIWNLAPVYPPGTDFRYSDVGYIVLGELVRVIDGRPIDRFAREEVFLPLGMKDTMYCPPESLWSRCAPTEKRDGKWMQGQVHDPRAWALGGVAGHAGLFSTAEDLARWCRMILHKGVLDDKRILSQMTVEAMTSQRCLPGGTGCRGYGFDMSTSYSSARGDLFQAGTTFGHTGYTGTSYWIDPTHDCYVILLTNRVHPDDKGTVTDLRRQVATAVAAAITGKAFGPPAEVLCGIDILKRDGFKPLAGRKVALITNHTGRDREGNRTVDLLFKAPEVKLVKLFSPEHGLYGTLDEKVGHTVDQATGLKVYSLYGETRRPTPEMLEGVDALVYDIQDIGARFYTYSATLGYALEAAAKHKLKMVVLDRPNPITGLIVDGPIADKNRYGFTAYGPLPVVHGMTFGELARMCNVEYDINCDLTVVELQGWRRSMWWDETGLMWINPSPNMRNLTQATLYPAICLLEATNVSVGRGTDQPFEIFGAPWIDGRKLAASLNEAGLPGLRFIPVEFTPTSSKFAKEKCQGVYVLVTDRQNIRMVESGLTIAWHLKKLFGPAFEVDKVINLLANAETLNNLKTAETPTTLPAGWRGPLSRFRDVRQKYLIYQN